MKSGAEDGLRNSRTRLQGKKKVRKENGADRKQVFSQREAGSSLHGHQHLDINTVRLRHCCVINSLPFFKILNKVRKKPTIKCVVC